MVIVKSLRRLNGKYIFDFVDLTLANYLKTQPKFLKFSFIFD